MATLIFGVPLSLSVFASLPFLVVVVLFFQVSVYDVAGATHTNGKGEYEI